MVVEAASSRCILNGELMEFIYLDIVSLQGSFAGMVQQTLRTYLRPAHSSHPRFLHPRRRRTREQSLTSRNDHDGTAEQSLSFCDLFMNMCAHSGQLTTSEANC